MIKTKNIITGGTGFIGSAFMESANHKYNYSIISRGEKEIWPNVSYYRGDYGDADFLKSVIKDGDTVLHLACSSNPGLSEKNRALDIKENLIKTIKLLEVCVEKKASRIIFLSSGGTVYGDYGNKFLSEDDETRPISSHGVMKLAIENYIKIFARLYNLPYVILRASNPYGWPTNYVNREQGIIDVVLNKAINNEQIEIWGDGSVARDFLHIRDLSKFLHKIIDSEIKNEIINVGTGVATDLNKILSIIEKLNSEKINVVYKKRREIDLMHNALNISKAKKLLNWEPEILIEDGIKGLHELIKNNGKQ